MFVHRPAGSAAAHDVAGATDDRLADLLEGEVHTDNDPRIEQVIRRVTGTYPFEALAHQPAVQTVSELKYRDDGAEDGSRVFKPFGQQRWTKGCRG